MTIVRIKTATVLLLLFVTACAKSNTRLGSEKDGGEESIQDGGARADVDLPSISESSSGSAATSGSVQPSETARAGNGGQEGTPIAILIDAGVDVSPSLGGILSPPMAVPIRDAAVRQARLDLISEYCSLLERFPCLHSSYNISFFDSTEEQISYCEQDVEIRHYETGLHTNECETEWQAVLECAIQYPYSCPCPIESCTFVEIDAIGVFNATSSADPCWEIAEAYSICVNSSEWLEITGERYSCIGQGNDSTTDHACVAHCRDDDVDGLLELACDGPTSGPFECACTLNSKPLRDAYEYADPHPVELRELFPDCESATRAMADGRCIDILGCCFTWINDGGPEGCGCTADPTRSSTGATTCEELADNLGGEVVDLCPQYEQVVVNSAPPR